MARTFIENLLLTVFSIFVFLIFLELIFRLLPISDSTYTQPVNEKSPYIHFRKNNDLSISKGYKFQITAFKHSNNYGYMDDDDFIPASSSPLVTVVGDSFVEALQVENKYTFHGLLDEDIKGDHRVYAIGLSGSPLSQYLAFLKFSRSEFDHRGAIINIYRNDFDESLTKYKFSPGLHFFKDINKDCSNVELVRNDYYGPGDFKNFSRKSALVRYLVLNAGINLESLGRVFKARSTKINWEDQTNNERIMDSKCAVDEFFRTLPEASGLEPDKILLIVDAPRPEIYLDSFDKNSKEFFSVIRKYFINQARKLNYEALDLTMPFIEKYKEKGEKFEFEIDRHWNKNGHKVVFEEIKKSRFYKKVFN